MAGRKPARMRKGVSQTAPDSESASAMMWRLIDATPGLNERLDAADARLEAGGGVLYEVSNGTLRKVRRRG